MEDVLDRIKSGQDIYETCKRLIEHAVNLYAEKTHFVYELLQNAEDVGATIVSFNQYPDRLEVMHNGIPFTESNLQSLCDAAKSDKTSNSNAIGRFGIGFKSVFAICKSVMLYTEPANRLHEYALPRDAFIINDYIHPSRISEKWSIDAQFTTKFVFPYDVGLYKRSIDELRIDIAKKLRNLGADVLLFMKHIKQIEYKILDIGSEYDGESIYMLDRVSLSDRISKVTTLGETDSKAHDGSYLVFSKAIENSERTVDIAFSIKEEGNRIIFTKSVSPYISMYFPTETESKLNFIVQAPFDLIPNRGNLEEGTQNNAIMLKLLEELFIESIYEIKNRGWLTLEFIDLLPYDPDSPAFLPSWSFYQIPKRTYNLLKNEEIIPAMDGSYTNSEKARIVRGAKLIDVFPENMLRDLLGDSKLKWLPRTFTENSPLSSLHTFFIKELGIEEISHHDLPKLIRGNPSFLAKAENEWLKFFYNYLVKDIRSHLGQNGDLATVPFIKTSDGNFNAPFVSRRVGRTVEVEPKIFLKPKSSNYDIEGFLFIDDFIQNECGDFVKAMGFPEPDAFDYYVKELEIAAAKSDIDPIENLNHIKQALSYFKTNDEKTLELLSNLLYLKVCDTTKNAKKLYVSPKQVNIYREVDYNGISIKDYFLGLNPRYQVYILDERFYLDAGLTMSDIREFEKLSVKNSVYLCIDELEWQDGTTFCYNKGDFRKRLDFAYIKDILDILSQDYRENEYERVRAKSAVIFKLICNVEKYLSGKWQYRKANPEIKEGISKIVERLGHKNVHYHKWLIRNSTILVSPSTISRYDLDVHIYGEVNKSSNIYDLLGFIKTEKDRIEKVFSEILGKYTKEEILSVVESILPVEIEDEFVPDLDVDEEYKNFPEEPIRNLQLLKEKAIKTYNTASNVYFEKRLRRIRTSKVRDKDHIRFRYKGYCQMCEEPSQYWEVAEIFPNPKKEIAQMNLSLCPNCASHYRILRKNDSIISKFKDSIMETDILNDSTVELSDTHVRFTKAHLAEVQEFIKIDSNRHLSIVQSSVRIKR